MERQEPHGCGRHDEPRKAAFGGSGAVGSGDDRGAKEHGYERILPEKGESGELEKQREADQRELKQQHSLAFYPRGLGP